MANRHRGEVSKKIGDTEYVFRIGANEWCDLEDEFGKTTDELIADIYEMATANKLEMRVLRSYFRVALVGTKPDITHAQAGALMNRLGLVEAATLLGEVVSAGLPDNAGDEPVKAEDATPNPPQAATA